MKEHQSPRRPVFGKLKTTFQTVESMGQNATGPTIGELIDDKLSLYADDPRAQVTKIEFVIENVG